MPGLGPGPLAQPAVPSITTMHTGGAVYAYAGLRPLGVTYPHVCVHVDETADPDRRAASSDTYTGIGHRTPLIGWNPVSCVFVGPSVVQSDESAPECA